MNFSHSNSARLNFSHFQWALHEIVIFSVGPTWNCYIFTWPPIDILHFHSAPPKLFTFSLSFTWVFHIFTRSAWIFHIFSWPYLSHFHWASHKFVTFLLYIFTWSLSPSLLPEKNIIFSFKFHIFCLPLINFKLTYFHSELPTYHHHPLPYHNIIQCSNGTTQPNNFHTSTRLANDISPLTTLNLLSLASTCRECFD